MPTSEVRSLAMPHQHHDARFQDIVASRRTTVTDNNTVVANLISLYLSWDHATLRILDEDYFLDELVSGGTDYCAPMLVNAMLCVWQPYVGPAFKLEELLG
jgi:hypothetical protein